MDIKVIGGAGILILLAMAVAGVFTTHNAVANPASPIQAPEISFSGSSSGSTSAELTVSAETLQTNVDAIMAAAPPQQYVVYFGKDVTTQGEKTDEVTGAKASWFVTVKGGLCNGYIRTTHTKDNQLIEINQDLNDKNPGQSFNCSEFDIMLMFINWLRQALKHGLQIAEYYFVCQRVVDHFIADLQMVSLKYGELWRLVEIGLGG